MKDRWECPHCKDHVPQWQPIETAPLNTVVHLWCADLGRTDITGYVYEKSSDGSRFSVFNGALGYTATHWHPLLAPPEVKL